MIVCFASSKGGVGKSTACAAIGAGLAQCGQQVLIMDLDQNRTVERFGRKATVPGLTVEAVDGDCFTTVFREKVAASRADHILIDLPGSREATALKAMARCDLVIIPAQASEPDLREALVIAGDVRDVSEDKHSAIPYRLLLTKMSPLRSRVTDHVYQELTRHRLPVFRTVMVERVAYREMFLNGAPPLTSDRSGAGAEISALILEMEMIIDDAQAPASPHNAGVKYVSQ